MAEYIKKDDLLDTIDELQKRHGDVPGVVSRIKNIIATMPTIKGVRCQICGFVNFAPHISRFCKHCGVRMDGDNNESNEKRKTY